MAARGRSPVVDLRYLNTEDTASKTTAPSKDVLPDVRGLRGSAPLS